MPRRPVLLLVAITHPLEFPMGRADDPQVSSAPAPHRSCNQAGFSIRGQRLVLFRVT